MMNKSTESGSKINHEAGTLTVERARARCSMDGVVVEIDGILLREEDLSAFLASNPPFARWRTLRFPVSGWIVLVEPAGVTSSRYRESLLEAGTGQVEGF